MDTKDRDEMTEAEALSENLDVCASEEEIIRNLIEYRDHADFSHNKKLYLQAQEAKVGTEIRCPWCGKKHKKTSYQKVFCSNYKTKGKKNCKDMFWNHVDDMRRERTVTYILKKL